MQISSGKEAFNLSQGLILIELNEVNFEYVRAYCAQGHLPTFERLIADHGVVETTSESKYEELEPWIQWVTAHTGLSLAEHGIFRLGDIHRSAAVQIWEALERAGKTVGAVSPMNASNRCTAPAFFVPDPWTEGKVDGPPILAKLYRAISQSVNKNAGGRVGAGSALWLLAGLARFAKFRHYKYYMRFLLNVARGRKWSKALFLDQLIADLYLDLIQEKDPDFSSLFLNAAAHIQHHYMFNSEAYQGQLANPDWYIGAQLDPIFEVYNCYDNILAAIMRRHPQKRLLIATGLHQDPHESVTYYWRLRDHAAFLSREGIRFKDVRPLMSRDFVVHFQDQASALEAENLLNTITSSEGEKIFRVQNRIDNLFIELVWDKDIPRDFIYYCAGIPRKRFFDDVVFVAIKNGQHNGIGYLLDTSFSKSSNKHMPLSDLPRLICSAFDLDWEDLRSQKSISLEI